MTADEEAPPRPGGTARLSGRLVARVRFGAMRLPGTGVLGHDRRPLDAAIMTRLDNASTTWSS
jgi:hypothetical protein